MKDEELNELFSRSCELCEKYSKEPWFVRVTFEPLAGVPCFNVYVREGFTVNLPESYRGTPLNKIVEPIPKFYSPRVSFDNED